MLYGLTTWKKSFISRGNDPGKHCQLGTFMFRGLLYAIWLTFGEKTLVWTPLTLNTKFDAGHQKSLFDGQRQILTIQYSTLQMAHKNIIFSLGFYMVQKESMQSKEIFEFGFKEWLIIVQWLQKIIRFPDWSGQSLFYSTVQPQILSSSTTR